MPEVIAKQSPRTPKTITASAVKKATQKQADLPTMENRGIPEIEAAAQDYATTRDERIAVGKLESTKKAVLIATMKKHGKQVYSYNGLEIDLTTSENVTVRAKKQSEDEEE